MVSMIIDIKKQKFWYRRLYLLLYVWPINHNKENISIFAKINNFPKNKERLITHNWMKRTS